MRPTKLHLGLMGLHCAVQEQIKMTHMRKNCQILCPGDCKFGYGMYLARKSKQKFHKEVKMKEYIRGSECGNCILSCMCMKCISIKDI